ncbi:MAG: PssE/Cps14G family polysaccharide biosynthesis glycosyltransferase [Flavobacteriaceae bacterium]
MILVTLGTFPTEFTRPLIELERLLEQGLIKEEVIVQNGHTPFESKFMTLRPFMSPDEITELYKKARVIISHAGTGSLIKGIKLEKKVIAVARLSKYNEMVDDHQVELLDTFTELNYIYPWYETDQLNDILNAIDSFEPSPYISKKEVIINYLDDYINSL